MVRAGTLRSAIKGMGRQFPLLQAQAIQGKLLAAAVRGNNMKEARDLAKRFPMKAENILIDLGDRIG